MIGREVKESHWLHIPLSLTLLHIAQYLLTLIAHIHPPLNTCSQYTSLLNTGHDTPNTGLHTHTPHFQNHTLSLLNTLKHRLLSS